MNFQAHEEMCAVMYLTLDANEEDPESVRIEMYHLSILKPGILS